MQDTGTSLVTRRRVIYIPGFDPVPPRRYRELYRKEAARQAAISSYEIAWEGRAGSDDFGWRVVGRMEGHEVVADIEILVWSDIVRAAMSASVPATFLNLLRTAWIYLRSGALWRLMRLRKGPVIAALYPVAMLLVQLGVALAAGYAVFRVSGLALNAWDAPSASGATALWIRGGIAGLVVLAIVRWFKQIDGRLYAYYLMQDYAFAASCNGANPDPLEARISEFADRVEAALRDDPDEVLVVGHSSGASIAISVVADLLRKPVAAQGRPTLSLLTLGQVVPMTAFLPDAHRLRADLTFLAAQDHVTWVDVSAPGDGCSFALCDPVSVSGVAPEGKRWPLVLSAAFSQTLSPERWTALRRRFFRLHFQYLCAFDTPQGYDYFQITAGPLTLGARYAHRAPSPSRIETQVNKHRSVRA